MIYKDQVDFYLTMHPGEGANGSMKSFPHTVVNTHGQTVVIPAFVFFVLRSFPFVQEEIDAALALFDLCFMVELVLQSDGILWL